jgi:membrane protease YdiL (CAAX protease family)
VFAALIAWCILGLAGWWFVLRRSPIDSAGRVFPTEWRTPDAIFAGSLALFYLAPIVASGGASQPLTPEIVRGGLMMYCMMLALLLAFVTYRGFSVVQVFGLAPRDWLRVLGWSVGCFVLTLPLVFICERLPELFGRSASESDEHIQYLLGSLPAGDKAMMIVLAVLVAPLFEEFVFRGVLYGVMRKGFGQIAAMASSALLFAGVHNNIPAIPAYFVLSIGFTLAYERTGSLWAPIVMHMLFNSVSVIAVLYFLR